MACSRSGGVSERQDSASPSRLISRRMGPAPSAGTRQLEARLGGRLGLKLRLGGLGGLGLGLGWLGWLGLGWLGLLGLGLGVLKTVPEEGWARRSEGPCPGAAPVSSAPASSAPASSAPASIRHASKEKEGRGRGVVSCGRT